MIYLPSLVWILFFHVFLITEVYSAQANIRGLLPNDIRSGSPTLRAKSKIPDSLIGTPESNKADVPGNPLDPEDFEKAEGIKIVRAPPLDGVDPILAAGQFQGDIILPSPHDASKLQAANVASDLPQKNAVKDTETLWINGVIPYVISASYDANERATIAKAMSSFHQNTCLRFVPRKNDPDYIFIKKGNGCSSAVGRSGGEQTVTLGNGCVYYGIVIHELMHASGFWHEQSRADRDSFVTIIWNNIQKGMDFNFQKYDWSVIQDLGVSYDTGSIMHYGQYSFAIDRTKPTIVANNGESIGQRNEFSAKDMKKLNNLYQCGGATTPAPIVTTTPAGSDCADGNAHCSYWASIKECENNPSWMEGNCKKSCNKCGAKCKDDNVNCKAWLGAGECEKSPSYMHIHCKDSCGLCKKSGPSSTCKDDNQYCDAWATSGECRVNPSYMLTACKKSCGKC